ncbi:glycosyltransferase [Winogradskyella poriferorum]|uniref:glycosyltransferase n=1 Tax=Winogradskyella poriferorum TaxID=307627 RepID=UPI003D657E2E
MTFAIFTLVQHKKCDNMYYGYAPYVREMDLWNVLFDTIIIVAPKSNSSQIENIDLAYENQNITFVEVPVFNVKSFLGILKLIITLPRMLIKIFNVMRKADHLHFRCPSNVSALASFVQLFFPKKKKTMRYAGNWDPNSQQPLGYRFQKSIFTNPYLTKNMTVLVYGKWPNFKRSMRTFFAATFYEKDKVNFKEHNYNGQLNFTFIGALVEGKQPLMAIKIIEGLNKNGISCVLNLYGDGNLKGDLTKYVKNNSIENFVSIKGNVKKETLMTELQRAHFNILPSKSEGWPKSLAEGMFYGVIPISTKVSCVEWMLDYGKRGILIDNNIDLAIIHIIEVINSKNLNQISKNAQIWSQQYTVERQAEEIKSILNA